MPPFDSSNSSQSDSPQQSKRLADILKPSTCPACAHHVAVPFYDGGRQPLTTLAWPLSTAEARTMKRLPLSFVRCVDCGHVYNQDFHYDEVPYSEKPNLMFNQGILWKEHLNTVCELILKRLPANPVVIEIGCGEGHLLRALAKARPEGRYVGFDPNGTIETQGGLIEAYNELFLPEKHMGIYKPDMIISRHVLEHLMNPLGFVQTLSFTAGWLALDTQLFIEVPCIDRVFETGRTADFFYEHNSNFTVTSLTRLLERCALSVDDVQTSYDNEVVFGLAQLGLNTTQKAITQEALAFQAQYTTSFHNIQKNLDMLHQTGQAFAIWGGTGKASAFINQYHLDAERFPLVVDSDPDKVGTYVPGMGQRIESVSILVETPVDTIIIATQWRANDIILEMQAKGIRAESILIEYKGHLIDCMKDPNPYIKQSTLSALSYS